MVRAPRRASAVPVGRWGERENGILEVARALYAAGGYENVSMASVAEAAGLSEGTLYNYFRNKRDLVLRVSLVDFVDRIAEAERIVATAGSLREGLTGLIAMQLRIIVEAREIYRIWLREVRAAKGYRRSRSRDLLREFSNQLLGLLERFGVETDPALGLTPAMMRDMVLGGAEQIAFTSIVQRRERELDIPRTAAHLADCYLRAFRLG
ncbi:MAG: helix-turn-helix domain-containing protein [Xanthobacteraceae bacterium]|jgi:AcrR family transcriptional regulator